MAGWLDLGFRIIAGGGILVGGRSQLVHSVTFLHDLFCAKGRKESV